MTTANMPARLGKAIFSYQGDLFNSLILLLDDCSDPITGCSKCPHLKACVAWWDLRVCDYLTQYVLKPAKLETLVESFNQIKTGHYKGNGHKRNG
jgi:hypothetical protein